MKSKSLRKFVALAMFGSMFGLFGGCNFNRIIGSLVDHTIFEFVEPFIGDALGAVTGLVE